MPALRAPSAGMVPALKRYVRKRTYVLKNTITTRARASRPDATPDQVTYAQDLGIEISGKDVVTLGAEIETAVATRKATRAARKATAPAAPRPATVDRRIRENKRFGSPTPRTDPKPDTPEQALERQRRAFETAQLQGWRQDPDDATMLLHEDGRRVRYNIAENELSSMTRQCVRGRRIGDLGTLHDEVSAWSTDVNGTQRGVDWQMKVDDARCKLKSVYPQIMT